MYRQRKTDREGRGGQRSNGHGWTVLEREKEREREVMKEKEGPCHLLCAEKRGRTDLSRQEEQRGDEERQGGRKRERIRDKKHEGK